MQNSVIVEKHFKTRVANTHPQNIVCLPFATTVTEITSKTTVSITNRNPA